MEELVGLIIQVLLVFPGALIRWALSGFTGTYASKLDDEGYENGLTGFAGWVVIVFIAWAIMKAVN